MVLTALIFFSSPAVSQTADPSASATTTSATNSSNTTQDSADNLSALREAFDNWMLRAYEGDRDAQFKVALMFSDGTGTEKDIEQAVYWYIQAARQGLASAQYNLGHKYLSGEGTQKNIQKAIQWWIKAAEQEHELAQFNVARAYYGGIGVEKSVENARYWFRKAAANNEPRSEKILATIFDESGNVNAAGKAFTTTDATTSLNDLDAQIGDQVGTKADNTAAVDSVAQDVATATSSSTEPKITGSVAVYNRPDKNSMLVSIISTDNNISIVKRTDEWLQISTQEGFPVWAYKDFLKIEGDLATVIGDNVNARAVPLILRGSVIGQLFKGSKLTVLDTKDQWVRVQSPPEFTAWIHSNEFDQPAATTVAASATTTATTATDNATPPATTTQDTAAVVSNNAEPTTAVTNTTADTAPAESKSNKATSYEFKNSRNDNDWLFALPNDHYTIQLASLSDDEALKKYLSNYKLNNDDNVKQFISNRNGIEWKYLLYGSYASRAEAETAKQQKKFKNSWIRNVQKIRKNRCVAWKTTLPTPKELKTYCQN